MFQGTATSMETASQEMFLALNYSSRKDGKEKSKKVKRSIMQKVVKMILTFPHFLFPFSLGVERFCTVHSHLTLINSLHWHPLGSIKDHSSSLL